MGSNFFLQHVLAVSSLWLLIQSQCGDVQYWQTELWVPCGICNFSRFDASISQSNFSCTAVLANKIHFYIGV